MRIRIYLGTVYVRFPDSDVWKAFTEETDCGCAIGEPLGDDVYDGEHDSWEIGYSVGFKEGQRKAYAASIDLITALRKQVGRVEQSSQAA